MRLSAAVVCALAMSGCAGGPSDSPHGSPNMTVLAQRDDRIMARLDNGLIVIAQRIDAAPVASVHCYVKTGLIYEGEWIGVGLSHFLEHLLSGGTTTTRTEDETNAILGRIGASTNAFTSTDLVAYYIDTSAEHAAEAIGLVSDWMLNSTIPDKEFEREKQVIGREFAMGRGEPGRIFWMLTSLIRYQNHPARHPVIGYEDEFVRVTRDELYTFYKRMYVPSNMVISVAGDIDPKAAVDQIAGLWKDAPAAAAPKIAIAQDEPVAAPRTIEGHADVEQVRLRLAWPGVRLASEHDYPLDVMAQALGQGELSRLTQKVRNEQQLVTDIVAYNYSAGWGEGMIGIDASLMPVPEIPPNVRTTPELWRNGHIEKAREAILAEVERIRTQGITDEELARAKRQTVAAVVFSAQTAHDRAARAAADFITTGDPDYLQRYAKAIQSVTGEQVLEAAKRFLDDSKLLTVTLLPNETPAQPFRRPPDAAGAADARKQIVDLDNARLVERFKRLDRLRESREAAEVSPITLHKLSNGQRVLIQRSTALPIVAMQWYHLGGLIGEEPGREGVAYSMAQMMRRGAGDLSADDISRLLEERGASLDVDAGNSSVFATAACLSEDWPTVLGVMADVIRRPSFPAGEWDKLRPRLVTQIRAQNDDWYSQLRNGFRAAYFGDHPWSQNPIGRQSVVEKITADDLRTYHASRFGAADGVIAVFGDIDAKRALAELERLFADMPARAIRPVNIPAPGPVEPRMVHIPTNKPTPAVMIGYAPGYKRADPDYAAMEVMNRVMSSFPVGRLDRRLRGDGGGLAYAVGSGSFAQVAPGYWALLFNTQPETIRPALEGALAEVQRIRTEPVDEATLLRAREKLLVDEARSRQTNADRAMTASLMELYGLGYDHSDRELEAIHKVTAADVLRVARKYLSTPVAAVLSREPIDPATMPALTAEPEAAGAR